MLLRNLEIFPTTKHVLGSSLVVQWLRLCTSIAEVSGLFIGWETKIPQAMQGVQKEKKYDFLFLGTVSQSCLGTPTWATGWNYPFPNPVKWVLYQCAGVDCKCSWIETLSALGAVIGPKAEGGALGAVRISALVAWGHKQPQPDNHCLWAKGWKNTDSRLFLFKRKYSLGGVDSASYYQLLTPQVLQLSTLLILTAEWHLPWIMGEFWTMAKIGWDKTLGKPVSWAPEWSWPEGK